jgi:ribosomal subunit interface protein
LQTPLELSFVDVDPSAAVEARIQERLRRLEGRFDAINSYHVYVSAPHNRQQNGRKFEIRVDLRVPGSELVSSAPPGDSGAHEDVHVAIRDAFDAIERQLDKWKDRLRGEVKSH